MKSSILVLLVLLATTHCLPDLPLQTLKSAWGKLRGVKTTAVDVGRSTVGAGLRVGGKIHDGNSAAVGAGVAAIGTGVVAGKVVVDAGTDLVSPDDVCYGALGCFSMSSPWYSLLRPLPAPQTPDFIDVHLYLYTRRRPARYDVVIGDGVSFALDASDYDGMKETYFITHGFASNGSNAWLSDMKNAILKRYDANVFLVDWGKGASQLNYFQVAANTRVVGATLAKFGIYLIDRKRADSSRFHIIGHSLGAQISSYMAKKIPRIGKLTALDPAQPAFEGFAKEVRLDKSDADFVQVIHTTSRPFIPFVGLGMIKPYGHIDFYMNGGWHQPGCILPPKPEITSFLALATIPVEVLANFISCPHGRSYEFLTATLENANCTFWGHQTNVVTKLASVLTAGHLAENLVPDVDCKRDTCSPLGFDAVNYPGRGSFAVATTPRGPFCVPEPQVDTNMRRFRNLNAG